MKREYPVSLYVNESAGNRELRLLAANDREDEWEWTGWEFDGKFATPELLAAALSRWTAEYMDGEVSGAAGVVPTTVTVTGTEWHCELCAARGTGTGADLRYDGQICDTCLEENGPDVYVVLDDEDDDDARYIPGLECLAEWADEAWFGMWQEFSNDEYHSALGKEWDAGTKAISHKSLPKLIASLEERMRFMNEFWTKHQDVLKARDLAFPDSADHFHWYPPPQFAIPIIRRVDVQGVTG